MIVTITPKDSCAQKLMLRDVATWYHSHGQYVFVFGSPYGSVRSYPDAHIWYIEVTAPSNNNGDNN
mgnify:CR=1